MAWVCVMCALLVVQSENNELKSLLSHAKILEEQKSSNMTDSSNNMLQRCMEKAIQVIANRCKKKKLLAVLIGS
jgi:predicted nucleotidyltransferase